MIDQKTKEMIHAEMDGELDEAARSRLEQALSASPEAREYRRQMFNLDAFLARAPLEEPPEGLHGAIMTGIRLPKARSRSFAAGFGVLPGFVRYGFAAAAGLLLAIGIYEYRPALDGAPDQSAMVGTIMPGANPAQGEMIDSLSFIGDEFSSEVSLLRQDDAIVLDFRLDTRGEPMAIRVDFAEGGLHFDTITQLDSELQAIEISDHEVRVEARGEQHFAVVLDGAGPAVVRMEWLSGGKTVRAEEMIVN